MFLDGFIVESPEGQIEFAWGISPPLGARKVATIHLDRSDACRRELAGDLEVVDFSNERQYLNAPAVLSILDDEDHDLYQTVSECIVLTQPPTPEPEELQLSIV